MNFVRVGCLKVKKWTDQAIHPVFLEVKDPQVRAMYDREELKQVNFRLRGLALFFASCTLVIVMSYLVDEYFDFN